MVVQCIKFSNVSSLEIRISQYEPSDDADSPERHVQQMDVEFVEDHSMFACQICYRVMDSPTQLTSCGHTFCNSCIQRHLKRELKCPQCGLPCTGPRNIHMDTALERKIHNLRVRCVNTRYGCADVVHLNQLETNHRDTTTIVYCPTTFLHALYNNQSHMLGCQYTRVMCPLRCRSTPVFTHQNLPAHMQNCTRRGVRCSMCRVDIPADELAVHEEQCRIKPVTCPQCQNIVSFYMLENHQTTDCQKSIVPCHYEEFGCKEIITRDNLEEHEYHQITYHMRLITTRLTRFMQQDPQKNPQLRNTASVTSRSLQSLAPSRNSVNSSSGINVSTENLSLEEQVVAQRRLDMSETIDSLRKECELNRKQIEDLTTWKKSFVSMVQQKFLNDSAKAKVEDQATKKDLEDVSKKFNKLFECSTQRVNVIDKTQKGMKDEHKSIRNYTDDAIDVTFNKLQRALSGLADGMEIKITDLKSDVIKLKENQANVSHDVGETEQLPPNFGREIDEKLKHVREYLNVGGIQWVLSVSEEQACTLELEGSVTISSDCFYSYSQGYKLRVTADFCGERLTEDEIEKTHLTKLTLSVHLMTGEYDVALTWPYSGRVNVRLIEMLNEESLMQHSKKFTDVDRYSTKMYEGSVMVDIKLLRNKDYIVVCQIDDRLSYVRPVEWFNMVDDMCIGMNRKSPDAAVGQLIDMDNFPNCTEKPQINGAGENSEDERELMVTSAMFTSVDNRLMRVEKDMTGVNKRCKDAMSMYTYVRTEVDAAKSSLDRVSDMEIRLNDIDTDKMKNQLRQRYLKMDEKVGKNQQNYKSMESDMGKFKKELEEIKESIKNMKKKQATEDVSKNPPQGDDSDDNDDGINARYIDTNNPSGQNLASSRMAVSDVRLKNANNGTQNRTNSPENRTTSPRNSMSHNNMNEIDKQISLAGEFTTEPKIFPQPAAKPGAFKRANVDRLKHGYTERNNVVSKVENWLQKDALKNAPKAGSDNQITSDALTRFNRGYCRSDVGYNRQFSGSDNQLDIKY